MKTVVKIMLLGLVLFYSTFAFALPKYEIEAAINDEKFIIDGEVYEATTYCLGWEEGDTVIFVDGTPGICVSATLYNIDRQETCDVWCE